MPDGALEKQMAEAKSRERKKIGAGVVISGLAAAVTVLAVALVIVFFNAPRDRDVADEITETVTPANGDGDDGDDDRDSNSDSDGAEDQFRAQFMESLAQYESEVEPKINALQLAQWNSEAHAQAVQLKTRALEAFARSEYLTARENLRRARELVTVAEAEHTAQLAAARRDAYTAFADDRAPEATAAVRRALQLKADDAQMLALEKRVAVLPEVLALKRRAQIAQTENRPQKEWTALQKILSLDGARAEIKPRVAELTKQLAEQHFATAVRAARRALDDGNANAAAQHINTAKKIFPANADIAELQTRLAEVRARAALKKQLTLGARAVANDDWQAAAKHFQRALQLKPGNKTAMENYDRARRIIAADKKIRRYLSRSERLGDKNVLAAAAKYAQTIKPTADISPALAVAHAELTQTITAYQTEVPVTVISDNATHISVRGEGIVGNTKRRIIQLRPGKRIFEGTRAGYQSKLVTVTIAPGSTGAEVTVICDEKI